MLTNYLQHPWVEQTLDSLDLDQKLGQMLHPVLNVGGDETEWADALADFQPGGVFFFPGKTEQFRKAAVWLQRSSNVPTIVSLDFENGAGRMLQDATIFPDLMALAAGNDPELAAVMGRAAAVEGRAAGVHWALGPVVDINRNIHNPITNTRSLGDDPAIIERLSTAMITAMQQHGMAACPKHFPGDGMDDRDQHLTTTVNTLNHDEWFATSGRMFQAAIDAGALTIMTGHIACPALDPGNETDELNCRHRARPGGANVCQKKPKHPSFQTSHHCHEDSGGGNTFQDRDELGAPPATLSHTLTTSILRDQMGFDGVILTDAIGMGGITSRAGSREKIIGTVEAGSDMILFCDLPETRAALLDGLADGCLTEDRIDASVRRILALKVALGIHENAIPAELTQADRDTFAAARDTIAERAATLVRDKHGITKTGIKPGSKVLLYHMRADDAYNVDGFDELARKEGWHITRIDENHLDQAPSPTDFDHILVLSVFGPNWGTGRIRWGGRHMRVFMNFFNNAPERITAVSFGSPYHIYEIPAMPCYINAYSPDPATQAAVMEILTGRKPAVGKSPVELPRSILARGK